MGTDKPRIYVDAAPIIDLVKYRVGVGIAKERESDAWHLQQLLRASRDGRIEIITSALSVAECTHVEDQSKLDAAKPFFLQLLTSGRGGIALAQPTLAIMEDARNLRWTSGLSFKGFDSVHAATALRFRCAEFLHRDGRFTKYASQLEAMGLTVCGASDTSLLPDEYRQGTLIGDP